ncbi:MAG: OmpA family protein [Lewinellaceae bacterium]|nr:OmpA family protein [Saprospiraceae bacterium]MCB9336818.1 OmpA family protein [Lewinellaceae bacterium]
MNFTLKLLGIILVSSLALTSCVSKKKFKQLEDEKTALASTLAQSQEKVNMLEGKVASLESEMESEKNRLNGEIANIKKDLDASKSELANAKKAVAEKEAQIAKIKSDVKEAFGLSSDVAVSEVNGDMYVKLENPVQYGSGSTRLNRNARKSIESLAKMMKNNPNMRLLIEGHADGQKYPSGSGMDNWQLSVNRAMVVVKRLIRQGVKPEQLTVAGRGDTAPVGDNKTKDGRSQNRRTEAKPNPATGKIYNIGN